MKDVSPEKFKIEEKISEKPKYTEADLERAGEESSFWNRKILRSVGTSEYEEDVRKHAEALNRYLEISRYLNPPTQKTPISSVEGRKYTLEDLEEERQWDSGFGPNNPGAFRRQLRDHHDRFKIIEDSLIEQGVLEKREEPEVTEQQKINAELDVLYPDAKSRKMVTYKGKKYQIRYFPAIQSRSGKTVHLWEHSWRPVKEK